MSIKLWEEIAKQKEEVENQRRRILNTFKEKKVANEMGSLKAERLFKPITTRLGAPLNLPAEREDFYGNLAVDPFLDHHLGDEMAELFEDGQVLLPPNEDFLAPAPEAKPPDDFFGPDPDEEEVLPGEKQRRGAEPGRSHSDPGSHIPSLDDPPPRYSPPPPYKTKRSEETNDLSTLEKFLKENKEYSNSRISTAKSKFFGWNLERVKYRIHEIYTGRAEKVLNEGRKALGQKSLGPYEGKSNKEMREMIDEFRKGQTGKGFPARLQSLIQRHIFNLCRKLFSETQGRSKSDCRASFQAWNYFQRAKNKNHVNKMSLSILLDSQIAKQQNPNQQSHDFSIRFEPPIVLDRNKNFKAALNELVTMSYSWYNVRAVYGNNSLKWKKKSDSTWQTITLPDGMFTYDDLNSFIKKILGKEEFKLFFDSTIFRAVIILYTVGLDLSVGTFADLLGFQHKVLDQATNVSRYVPNITRGVDWIFIHCDLITRDVKNVGTDVLISLPTSTRHISESFSVEPKRLQWHTVNKSHIDTIRVYVTDGRNGILDMNGLDMAISVFIEEEGKIRP